METVRGALLEMGLMLERESGVFGAAPKSPEEYIRDAVKRIREIVCPHSADILQRLHDPTTDVVTFLFDLVSPHFGNHIPGVGSVMKKVAEIGIALFCADPEGTLGKAAGV
ncbi:hypothetical protein SBA3_1250027 [Candidatus Sulfopaludibacter sp. SbA3]|nr:hypothetical protein SBA3_1250027 [Candidatus Sulfopaludibacter sp. SbA3]